MLTLPPTPIMTALDVLTEAPIFLTAASGVWVPPPGLQRALIVATAPGADGTPGVSSGGAGGTAIEFLDLTLVASLAFAIGATTTIDALVANAGSGIAPGGASGGMLNLNGGRGFALSNFTDLSAAFCVASATTGFHEPLAGYVETANSMPGGASFWGSCDATAPNTPTIYGAGGPAAGAQAGAGGPGVIMIMRW